MSEEEPKRKSAAQVREAEDLHDEQMATSERHGEYYGFVELGERYYPAPTMSGAKFVMDRALRHQAARLFFLHNRNLSATQQ